MITNVLSCRACPADCGYRIGRRPDEGAHRRGVDDFGDVIVFGFVDQGYVDGIDFTTDCADQVTPSHLDVGDTPLPADRVQLGEDAVHPSAPPVTITR